MAGAASRLFPQGPTSLSSGLPFCTLGLVAAVSTARSLVHMFAPDGGAQSIAGIPVHGTSGANIVAVFGQWGASQLLLALIFWAVLIRYRALVPFMWLIVLLEQVLRFVEGHIKPVVSMHTPPGAYGTYVVFVVAALMLFLSLRNSAAPATLRAGP
jgi:hypothetical protein